MASKRSPTPDTPLPSSQEAYLLLTRLIERAGLSRRGFLDRLADLGFVFSEHDFTNWGRPGRSFPRDWAALRAMLRVLVEGQAPRRRCTPIEALRFLGLIGMPFTELRPLATLFPSDELNTALAAYLPEPVTEVDHLTAEEADEDPLVMALQRLAALPIDVLPEPAPLPPGSRMPFNRNPLFVGRRDDLLALARALKGGATAAIGQVETAAATGLGGIGKTQLAVEFTHCYGQFFAGGVFWLSFAGPDAVPSEIAACGGSGFMQLRSDFGALPLDEQVRLVLAAWQNPLPRLLVFDNCEDEALLARWRPTTGGCHVLVTSRRAQWDATLGVHALPLDVLSRDESVTLLRKHWPGTPADIANFDAIAAELGDLPLAVHLAGAYLARYRHAVTPIAYLTQLQRLASQPGEAFLNHPSLRGESISPTGHVQHVARTFALSYDQFDANDSIDRLALALLARAAYFAPGEPIPRDLLLATLSNAPSQEDTTFAAEDALARMVAFGLAETGVDGAVRLHRLVAAFAQTHLVAEDAQAAVEQTVLAVAIRLNDPSDPVGMLALQPHLRFVTETALQRNDEPAAFLCETLGYHLWVLADYQQAQQYLERALAIHEQMSPPDALKIAKTLNLLALVSQMQCRFAPAQARFEQALLIWEQVLGRDHPATAVGLNNVGYLALLQGNYDQAQSCFQRALTVRRRLDGLRSIETARIVHNLGYLFQRQGRYHRARRYLKLALAIRAQVLPANHLSTAATLNFLGEVLYLQADYAGAWQQHERALAMRTALYGDRHHDVAESLYNLGRVLHAQGQLEQARSYLEQALTMDLAMLGADQLDTVYVLDALGALLCDQGQYGEAQAYLEQALAGQERFGGRNYPESVSPLNHLGQVFLAQGNTSQARVHIERALTICREKLGNTHPDTAQSLNTLGMLLEKEGNDAEARSRYEEALPICTRSLGPNHPTTRAVQASLDAIPVKQAS